jgi:biopolymer transport protein ExbB
VISIIQAAGWPIWPLILCSVAGLALIIERFLSLRTRLVHPPTLVDEVMTVSQHGVPSEDILGKLAASSSLGSVLAAGFRAIAAVPRLPEADLRQALENAGREAIHRLERYLNAIGTIATSAPLLGLLGTVVGMIEIFGAQSAAGGAGSPPQLAYGISVALYNTAFGLIVAIPSLMCHRHFRARVEGYRLGMELAVERIVPHMMRIAGHARHATD